MVEQKQTKQLDLLIKDITRQFQQSEGVLLAEIRSAFPLDASGRAALKHYLQQATGAQAVEFEESTDPALLSGVVVRTADQELDTTAWRNLKQLASLNFGGK